MFRRLVLMWNYKIHKSIGQHHFNKTIIITITKILKILNPEKKTQQTLKKLYFFNLCIKIF